MSIWPFECQREAVETIDKRLDVLESAKPGVERKQFYGPMEPAPSDVPIERCELAGGHRVMPNAMFLWICAEARLDPETGEKLAEPQEQEPESAELAELRRKAKVHDALAHLLNDRGRVVDELTQRAEAAERELAECVEAKKRNMQAYSHAAQERDALLKRANVIQAERDALARKNAELETELAVRRAMIAANEREKAGLEKRLADATATTQSREAVLRKCDQLVGGAVREQLTDRIAKVIAENDRRKGECGGFECVDSEELAELRRRADNIEESNDHEQLGQEIRGLLETVDSAIAARKAVEVEPEPPKCSWCNRPAVEASETEWKCPTSSHRWPKEAAP
jgi:hypothetical protein